METKIINDMLIINNVPLEEVSISPNLLKIDLDDIDEKRRCVSFKQVQAFKMTTSDCFDKSVLIESGNYNCGRYKRHILEVLDSEWIKSLNETLILIDESADFLRKSHHYIIDCGDNIYEVVAWVIEFI